MAGGPFADRVVLVTGAGRGLGRSHAQLLASLGAALMLNDAGVQPDGSGSDDAPVKELERELASGGISVAASTLNLGTRDACRRLVDETVARFGRIDALIHSAGIVDRTALESLDRDRLAATLAVNLEAAVWLCQAALRVMRPRGYGRVVVTVSGHGLFPTDPPSPPAYALGKAAQFGLMNALAIEAAADGVLINAISPVAATRVYTGPDPDRYSPEAVSPGVAYLASERCRDYGLVLRAAGGMFALGSYAATTGWEFTSPPTFADFEARWNDIVKGPFRPMHAAHGHADEAKSSSRLRGRTVTDSDDRRKTLRSGGDGGESNSPSRALRR